MPRIHILSDRVANQIAAGEVIERPAAVVKELVENALDAGATRVEIEFRSAGRALLRVSDNGSGMSREDAQLALERHATSKIAEAGDLERLNTFGFRGEALPSIASVSDFVLRTREPGADAGTEIAVSGGKLKHVRECGTPVGTSIEVLNLFHPVPARRKFLKTDQTEAAHIAQCVRLYALSCPRTSFTLIEDGRVIFRSPECVGLSDRIREIFGKQIGESLLALEANEPGLSLTGLIGRPGVGRATRHEMITFVNARPVDNRTLNYALIESYSESLPKGRYPLAFVFLEIDPAAVDVNVHPAKREVRFRNEGAIRGFVIRAVLSRLRLEQSVPVSFTPASGAPNVLGFPASPTISLADIRGSLSPSVGRPLADAGPSDRPQPPSAAGPASASGRPTDVTPSPAVKWRYLGLAHANYALFETATGILVLDRRSAHERVWFERLLAEFQTGKVASQRLLLPIPVELDPVGTALLLDRLKFFGDHGFEIAEFGRNFFRIEAIPTWADAANAELFLRDVLGSIREGLIPGDKPELARDALAKLAAAKATRLASNPTAPEIELLVRDLMATRNPLTSPSGKLTCFELSQAEVARRLVR